MTIGYSRLLGNAGGLVFFKGEKDLRITTLDSELAHYADYVPSESDREATFARNAILAIRVIRNNPYATDPANSDSTDQFSEMEQWGNL